MVAAQESPSGGGVPAGPLGPSQPGPTWGSVDFAPGSLTQVGVASVGCPLWGWLVWGWLVWQAVADFAPGSLTQVGRWGCSWRVLLRLLEAALQWGETWGEGVCVCRSITRESAMGGAPGSHRTVGVCGRARGGQGAHLGPPGPLNPHLPPEFSPPATAPSPSSYTPSQPCWQVAVRARAGTTQTTQVATACAHVPELPKPGIWGHAVRRHMHANINRSPTLCRLCLQVAIACLLSSPPNLTQSPKKKPNAQLRVPHAGL
jgi:hypothetical protein